jgi:hypothetical protein
MASDILNSIVQAISLIITLDPALVYGILREKIFS